MWVICLLVYFINLTCSNIAFGQNLDYCGQMFLFMRPHLGDLEITEITEIWRSCSHVWEVTLELRRGERGANKIFWGNLSSPYLSFCHNNLSGLQLTIGKLFSVMNRHSVPDKSVWLWWVFVRSKYLSMTNLWQMIVLAFHKIKVPKLWKERKKEMPLTVTIKECNLQSANNKLLIVVS